MKWTNDIRSSVLFLLSSVSPYSMWLQCLIHRIALCYSVWFTTQHGVTASDAPQSTGLQRLMHHRALCYSVWFTAYHDGVTASDSPQSTVLQFLMHQIYWHYSFWCTVATEHGVTVSPSPQSMAPVTSHWAHNNVIHPITLHPKVKKHSSNFGPKRRPHLHPNVTLPRPFLFVRPTNSITKDSAHARIWACCFSTHTAVKPQEQPAPSTRHTHTG